MNVIYSDLSLHKKPVFQTRFKRLGDSLFLWQSPALRVTTSTVRINNVSVITFLRGTIIIQTEKSRQYNNLLIYLPDMIIIIV